MNKIFLFGLSIEMSIVNNVLNASGNGNLIGLEAKLREFIDNHLIEYNLSDIIQLRYIIIFIFQYYNYESVIVEQNNSIINIYIENKIFVLDLNDNVLYTGNILTDNNVIYVNSLRDVLEFVLDDIYLNH